MSSGPPSPPPTPSSPSPPPPPSPPRPTGFFDQFRYLPWWETLLVVAPLSLIFIGGLIGGVIGGSAAIVNMQVARRQITPVTKALVMLGVVFAAYVVFFILRAAVLTVLRATTA